MNSTKFVRFFSNSRSILLRAGNKQNYSHNGWSRNFGNHFTSMAIGTGTTGTLLGLSFWGSSKNDDDKSRFSAVPSANKELQNLELIIRETDALYNNYLIDNAYAILKKHAKGTNSELLWRLARVLCEKGKMSKDKEEQKTFFMQAYETCKKALDNEPIEGSFGAHKWMGIILDYVGEIEGRKSRIEKSFIVKEHFNRALEINPLDATTWHLLGIWHFTFADMPSYQYYIAKAVFNTPPTSTYEEALSYFEKAETIQPEFYSRNTFYLAECYDRLGRKDDAKFYYMKAFKMPVISVDDKEVHDKAFEKLKGFGVKTSDLTN